MKYKQLIYSDESTLLGRMLCHLKNIKSCPEHSLVGRNTVCNMQDCGSNPDIRTHTP
jgi:hypothetical protein